MKNNFKKLTRDEQLMVNGGEFNELLWCKYATGCRSVPVNGFPDCGAPAGFGSHLSQICGFYTGQSGLISAGGLKSCVC